jgi:cytochrome c oxidase subunit I
LVDEIRTICVDENFAGSAVTVETPTMPIPRRSHLASLAQLPFSLDHKVIGIGYLLLSLGFLCIGGMLAMLMRWQLAWPSDPHHPILFAQTLLGWPAGIMAPEQYNTILTLHGTIMIFFVVIPILTSGFGNYLLPLKIGARNLAMPRATPVTLWMTLAAGVILLCGIAPPGGGASSGWTAYPPLSAILANGVAAPNIQWLSFTPTQWPIVPAIVLNLSWLMVFAAIAVPTSHKIPSLIASLSAALIAGYCTQIVVFDGQSAWFASILLLSAANVIGAINAISTIVTLRCPGMTFFRMPLFVWALFFTAFITLLATPVLAADLLMNLLDHARVTSFFEPTDWMLTGVPQEFADGGIVLLHPHLFWFYSHPAVYIMILPAMGIVSDILPVFARKPMFGYSSMVIANLFIAVLGFVVWGHHMFQSGMNPLLGTTFAVSTMAIAAPSGVKTFNWIATLWGGRIQFTLPLLNAVAFVALFVVGGLSGIFLASTAVDTHLHMTYFVVAHIHYVLFGGSLFGIFAGIYFWYPKMFGRMLGSKLGYLHFALSFIAFNCTFFPMHWLGLQGMVRRIADPSRYEMYQSLMPLNRFITQSAFGLGMAQIPFIVNFIGSIFWGKRAPNNPWNANTLEWTTTSPPLRDNFESRPVAYRGPYEYSAPGQAADWLPQNQKP